MSQFAGKTAEISVSILCSAFVQTRIHDSHRDRPSQYQSDADSTTSESRSSKKAKEMERGIEVSIAGKRVVEALNYGELYIFAHPNYRPVIQQRSGVIDAAFERVTQSPLL